MSNLLAITVGNTRTKVGLFREGQLDQSEALVNTDIPSLQARLAEILEPVAEDAQCLLASVNDPVASKVEEFLSPRLAQGVLRFRRDLGIPIANALADDSTVGQDRLLNAVAAFDRAKQACVVVDVGTAVTVDFIDGQGVFQGGAIAPGLNAMLQAMHARTAALPAMQYQNPDLDPETPPFGRDTRDAMLRGVRASVIGLTRYLVEAYAEHYAGYPTIIATGGDARTLFENDDLVEHIVPELTLLGIHASWRIIREHEGDDVEDGDEEDA